MPPLREAFERAVAEHDEAIAATGVVIWIGAEPTFTDRASTDPAWLVDALGADKEDRARRLLADLRDRLVQAALHPHFAGLVHDAGARALESSTRGLVLRSVGRRYPGEERPRWSYGLYCLRDGAPLWGRARDPLEGIAAAVRPDAPRRVRDALVEALRSAARTVVPFDIAADSPLRWRLAYRVDGGEVPDDPAAEPPPAGVYVLALGVDEVEGCVRIELPALPDVPAFVALLQDLAAALSAAGEVTLVVGGQPPPVNASAAWTTATPDPGVLEINMAPAPNVSTFLKWLRELYAAAGRHDLAPYRIWYNGDVADSGGGGHITLGGPSPEQSPFFVHPHLLPSLIAYLNHHPSLSYLFAVDSLGSSSQSPRPDEGVRESFDELGLALALLARLPAPSPEQLWGSLAPFLADRLGNVHRAEVNVEKLWNPYLPGRGKWGVVELRALRMPPTPERAAALAALFRALAAMLARWAQIPSLIDWGPVLHDRFALPFFLQRDLECVLADLDAAGLGLPGPLADALADDDHRVIGEAAIDDARVTIKRAIEFWPLVGDPSQQEARTARLIDSSTMRLEIVVRGAALERWRLAVGDVLAPLPEERDASGPALVLGVRLRAFVPTPGLHPTLGKQLPIELLFHREGDEEGWLITLHDWSPNGVSYEGLPEDLDEAARRRAERFVVTRVPLAGRTFRFATADALTPHALDVRRL
jgi:uncharacterized protein (DUF2126 family)